MRRIIIGAAAAVVLAGGGAAAYVLTRPSPPAWCAPTEKIINSSGGTDWMLSQVAQRWPGTPPSPLIAAYDTDVTTLGMSNASVRYQAGSVANFRPQDAAAVHAIVLDVQRIDRACRA